MMLARIRDLYGLSAEELVHIPSGEYAACYAVRAGAERFFLKIWPEPVSYYVSTESTVAMLHLTRQMHERGLFDRVSYPVATRDGALSAMVGGRLFALFPFIEGRMPEPSAAFASELGRGMAELHRATHALAAMAPRREKLEIVFEASLRAALAEVAAIGPANRPALRALRERIEPITAEVLETLDRLVWLQAKVRALDTPFVLCHRDLGVWNTIADRSGRVIFIDWDDVSLAPPEHDVFAGGGPWFRECLEAYAASNGPSPLHAGHFAFVLWRRILDDMHWRIRYMVTDPASREDDHQLYGIDTYVLPQWHAREETFAMMADTLRASGLDR
jgi:spectinomycin phosphotransferase